VRLVAVTGGKGGPGATTLAVGLASVWAAAGHSVLLVDLDPAGGDVAVHLPVSDVRRGLAPLLGLPRLQLGPEAVVAESAQVTPTLRVLVGLARPDAAGLLHGDAAHTLLDAARRIPGLELLVVDAGRLLPGSVAAAVVGLAEVRVLAVRADLPGALAAQRALASTRHAAGMVPVAVGVQRPADVAELAEALGRPVAGAIPADPGGVRRAIQSGRPPTTGRLGRAYSTVAAQLHPTGGRAARGRAGRGRRRVSLGALGPGEPAAAACLRCAAAT
jgi:MinD-like ATPase involved in chromosome partitioning or flagellar assembly